MNYVSCQCGEIVEEYEELHYCECCSDTCCYLCQVHCEGCREVVCMNCANGKSWCLRCESTQKSKESNKVVLVINGGIEIPCKNGEEMLAHVQGSNNREITLKLEGKEYRFLYRVHGVKEYKVFFEEKDSQYEDWSVLI